jgi:hypothetical protein
MRAAVEAYYRNGIRTLISEAVDEAFNRIDFRVDVYDRISYNCVLACSANNLYGLSYKSCFGTGTKSKKELSAASPQALSSAMSRSGYFPRAAIDEVLALAAQIPTSASSH